MLEPIAARAGNGSHDGGDNTYFVSFLLRDPRNKTAENDDANKLKQRMIVNNNFNGEKMGTSQVYVESGPPPKQAPAHNIQLLNRPQVDPQPQAYPQPGPQQSYQQPQKGVNYG